MCSFTIDASLVPTKLLTEQFGGVAHRLEQAAHNHLVVGSTPTAPTKSILYLLLNSWYFRRMPHKEVKWFNSKVLIESKRLAPKGLIYRVHESTLPSNCR